MKPLWFASKQAMDEKSTQQLFDFDAKPEAIYTVDDIFEYADQALIQRLGEDRRIERKNSRYSGESLGTYFSMWANSSPSGGLIAVGIANDGTIEGCGGLSTDAINRLETTGHVFASDARYRVRRVAVQNDAGSADFVLLFRVDYHPTMVVKTSKGDAYIRRGDQRHRLTAEESRELAVDKGQVPFEEEPCSLNFPDEFDMAAVRAWAQSVTAIMESGANLSPPEVLANRHLGRFEGEAFVPNNACALMFAKDPRRVFPGCRVRFLRFEGDSEGTGENYNAVKDIWIEGTIPQVIERAGQVIEGQLRTFRPLSEDGKFDMIEEYPRLAWYEAIVNACVHRSYGNGMRNISVFVRMFDSRLEIESPGPFPPFVTAENIYQMHKPRNPRVMEALFFLRLVQMNREGTRRMREMMAEMGLPEPEFSQKEIGHALVRVTLLNNIHLRKVWVDRDVSELIGDALAASLTEEEKRIVNWIAENVTAQVNDVVRTLGIGWDRANTLLLGLASRGVLQYIRFKPFEKNVRDGKAYFRLASAEVPPEGAHVQPVLATHIMQKRK